MQDLVDNAVAVLVHGIPFPIKALQLVYVPLYDEQASEDSKQPLPLVTQPDLYN